MECPVCGARATVLARPAPWTFARCTSCGTYFVDPMPPDTAIGEHYTEVYYGGEPRANEHAFEQATDASSAARITSLERALGRTGRILDVGCGTGFLLAAAKKRGWDARGVEVSARAAEFARAAHGVDIVIGTLADANFEPASFDAVTLVHVLEHVADPLGLLAGVKRVLKPDGVLGLAIPNPRALLYAAYNVVHRARGRYGKDKFSCSLFPPSHLYAWDARAIAGLLTRAGFTIEDITITGKGDPTRYPVVSWKGAGRWPVAQRAAETLGRVIGRGSLIEVRARA